MIPFHPSYIPWAAVAVSLLVAGWQYNGKRNVVVEFQEYRLQQNAAYVRQQEIVYAEIVAKQKADRESEARTTEAVQKAVLAYGPLFADYEFLAARVRLDKGTGSGTPSAETPDALASAADTGQRRLEELRERFVAVVESAGRVSRNLVECEAGIVRYREAVQWYQDITK